MRLGKNVVLVGLGVAAALVLAVAASAQDTSQEPTPQAEKPAQLDRTYGDGADESGATGGAGEAGEAPARDVERDRPRATDGGTGGSGVEDKATRDDHTNIILYGPNGIPAEAETEPTQPGAAEGGAANGAPEPPR